MEVTFIKLHEKDGNTEIVINVDSIVAIRDLRSDNVIKDMNNWQWTNIYCNNGKCFDVLETTQDIFTLLNKATNK